MIPLIVILSIITVLLYIFTVKISFCVQANNNMPKEKFYAFIKIGFLKFVLFPSKPKKKKALKRIKKEKKEESEPKKIKEKNEKKQKKITDGKSVKEIISFSIDLAKKLSLKFKKYLKFDFGYIFISVGTDDAYKTAMMYGGVSQSVVYLKELLEQNINAEFKRVCVVSDFSKNKTEFYIKLKISIRFHQILNIGFTAVRDFIKEFMLNKEKKTDNDNTDNKSLKSNFKNKNKKEV